MSEIEKKKINAVKTLLELCPRCERGETHQCPVSSLVRQVNTLRAVPVNVNDRLYSVLFMNTQTA